MNGAGLGHMTDLGRQPLRAHLPLSYGHRGHGPKPSRSPTTEPAAMLSFDLNNEALPAALTGIAKSSPERDTVVASDDSPAKPARSSATQTRE